MADGLAGRLEQLVGLDDRLGELGHRHPAVLALPLQEPEGLGLVRLRRDIRMPLARSISFRSREGQLEVIDVLVQAP